MAIARISMDIIEQGGGRGAQAGQNEQEEGDRGPLIKYYQATELIPGKKPLLHKLLEREPAAWASLQIGSGILTFALGIVFAVTAEFKTRLLTLFRVPLLTGILFFIAGLLSNLLYKSPQLLPVCFCVNAGCLVVAGIGVILMCVDLSFVQMDNHFKMEILVLCVTLMEMSISAVLTFWIHRERRRLAT